MLKLFYPTRVVKAIFMVYMVCLAYDGFGQASDRSFRSIKNIEHVILYKDTLFYAAFPSVIRNQEGELIVAFRRAPERKLLGNMATKHADPNSYLVAVRSRDGKHWSDEPTLIAAHPFGGSQDPCLLQLKSGVILCASYAWAFLDSVERSNLKKQTFSYENASFLGGYIVRSMDDGKTWSGPAYPPNVPSEINFDPYGKPIPAYNRGAMYQARSGKVYWVVASIDDEKGKSSNHLLVSEDEGSSWKYTAEVAKDDHIAFNEASVYETPNGDIVAFLRTGNFDSQGCIARSKDGGKTFTWESMGFKGFPFHALRLPDNRVLLTYGYRGKPYGIRARILNAECTDYQTAEEFVIRDDGGTWDLGYPWSIQLDEKNVLVTYYINVGNGTRHIAGSILEIESVK